MCLILLKWAPESDTPLTVLANRDEFHGRPSHQADFWDDHPRILGGRDEQAGGTWMAITVDGRFAAVTNYRSPSDMQSGGRSRGELPVGFLTGRDSSLAYLDTVAERGNDYAGFNLLVFDGKDLGYWSNRSDRAPSRVEPGIHGLSNALLDTPWPKVVSGKKDLERALEAGERPLDFWLDVLSSSAQAPDDQLPDTGVGLEKERVLSARCIESPGYGTRCSSLVALGRNGHVTFAEKTRFPADLDPDLVVFRIEPA